MTIGIVDTSILVELLDLPGKASRHDDLLMEFQVRVEDAHTFLLPVPVLLEMGNHIAQLADGTLRRRWAEKFVEGFARPALSGDSPFRTTPSPAAEEVSRWLDDFPDHATRQIGLVDRSLIDLFERQVVLVGRKRRVYIWSLDAPLMAYDTGI